MNTTGQQIIASHLGAELSDTEVAKLAELMRMKELKIGDYLISEGEADDSLYVIVEGNLEVVKHTAGDGTASIGIVRQGHLTGELSFLDGTVHTVGLRALGDCKVLGLSREDFEKIIDEYPRLVFKVMAAVARSTHRIMHQMNHDFIELSNYVFKQHGRY